MSFLTVLESDFVRVVSALEKAKPVVAQAQATVKSVEVTPGVIGQGAAIADEGLTVLKSLLDELEALAAKVQPSPAPPAAA